MRGIIQRIDMNTCTLSELHSSILAVQSWLRENEEDISDTSKRMVALSTPFPEGVTLIEKPYRLTFDAPQDGMAFLLSLPLAQLSKTILLAYYLFQCYEHYQREVSAQPFSRGFALPKQRAFSRKQ